MNGCAFEQNVLRAVVSDEWTESLRAHVAGCADCAAAADVAAWMDDFAVVDERPRALPDPAVLWLKAKLLGATAEVQRASRPITRVQQAAYAVIAACWAALLTWKWSALAAWAESFTPRVALAANSAQVAQFPVTLLVVVAMLASATVAVAMHTILAEE